MDALEACGQGGGIISDDEIARIEQLGDRASRQVLHPAIGLGDEQLGRAPVAMIGDAHAVSRADPKAESGKAASIAAMIWPADSSGRLRVLGSASGRASACSGVSMSPGSMARKRT